MVTIGIPTYNRINTLVRMADSLHESNLPVSCHVRIYDDASTEYNEKELRDIFPEAESICRHSENLGADGNMRYMYEAFLRTEDKYFFNADSDLIFRKDWLKVLMRAIKGTDGLISAFNTSFHECVGNSICHDGIRIVRKKSLGAAGTLFSRNSLVEIMNNLDKEASNAFDWRWSKAFQDCGYNLWAVEDSVVQHIGFSGFNSDGTRFAFGSGFQIDSNTNGQILNDTLLEISEQSQTRKNKMLVAVFPFSDIPRDSNIIIYGAGLFGNQYLKQIELTHYCNVIAVADKNFETLDSVINPATIGQYSYDYIVIAVNNPIVSGEIATKLCSQGIRRECIIENCNTRVIRLT